ncbi:MAG: cytochrome c3 family protein [Oryzomonas sp.]|uniref:cytochrome c3 family protein n=1 Tax=Oryzomonas sp. TaxID=2855186 RepID=UPI002845B952|nr:cytochrome c3 family protein [Oryzomonas sp.]MDR3579249.1 cytochrome c3 family protein [Oryzomonas sp.]
MRNGITCVIILAVGALGSVVFATSDKALLYGGAGQGRVIFDGRLHASRGLVCKDCHSDIFETKKKALITMDDHFRPVACFTCHDGSKVFNDCEKCHRKF